MAYADSRHGSCLLGLIACPPGDQAIAYEHYLKAGDRFAYMGAQEAARRAGAGIWGLTFIPIADWRHHGARLECER